MRKHFLSGSASGEPKFAFLYVVISTAVIAGVMTFSGIAGLAWWQSVLLLVGCLIGGWATLFSLLELRGLAQTPKDRTSEEDADPYAARTVVVAPATGEPYPHHEDYVESQGFDQGQLTSRIPDSTPFVDRLLSRRDKKEMAAR